MTEQKGEKTAGPATWIWAAFCVVGAAVVFAPVLVYDPDPNVTALAEHWLVDENYSYGFLIVPLAAYFAWEERWRLEGLPAAGEAWGLAVMLGSVAVFAVGTLGGVLFLARVSAIGLLFGAIGWIGGRHWARALAFPVAFLLLMLPIPAVIFNQIAFPLQLFAARVAAEALFLLEIPVRQMGNVITLAHTQLEVAEACSGLRSLLALITTAVVFSHFFARSWPQRIAIVIAAVPIAVVVNAARVTGTGFLAHRYGLEVATGYYHTMEGIGMFAVAFVLITALGFALIAVLPGPRESST